MTGFSKKKFLPGGFSLPGEFLHIFFQDSSLLSSLKTASGICFVSHFMSCFSLGFGVLQVNSTCVLHSFCCDISQAEDKYLLHLSHLK